jgi:hypothetical protein
VSHLDGLILYQDRVIKRQFLLGESYMRQVIFMFLASVLYPVLAFSDPVNVPDKPKIEADTNFKSAASFVLNGGVKGVLPDSNFLGDCRVRYVDNGVEKIVDFSKFNWASVSYSYYMGTVPVFKIKGDDGLIVYDSANHNSFEVIVFVPLERFEPVLLTLQQGACKGQHSSV